MIIFFLLLIGPFILPQKSIPTASGASATQTATEVDKHYNNLHTLRADFDQIQRGSGEDRIESGKLMLSKPGRMRWEYHQPHEKLFLTDGKSAWLYVAQDHQARRTPIKNLDDLRSPLRFLLGHSELAKELQDLKLAAIANLLEKDDVILSGTPKHDLGADVSLILIEVTPAHAIRRIIMEQPDGGATEFRFTNSQENIALDPALFRFTPPKGVEVVDGNIEE